MLRYVLFDLKLFPPEEDPEKSRKGLLWLLESLTRWNELYLEEHPNTPKLYESGVRYALPEQFSTAGIPEINVLTKAIPPSARSAEVMAALDSVNQKIGGECFRDIPRVIEKQFCDCDNLACARAAELRRAGVMAKPYIIWRKRPDGGMTYHALVIWPDGTSEDPSLILGMGGVDRAADRAEELRKNAERAQMVRDAVKNKKTSQKAAKSITALLAASKAVSAAPPAPLSEEDAEAADLASELPADPWS